MPKILCFIQNISFSLFNIPVDPSKPKPLNIKNIETCYFKE